MRNDQKSLENEPNVTPKCNADCPRNVDFLQMSTSTSEIKYINTISTQPTFGCTKLTTETLKQGGVGVGKTHWRRSGVFIVNFEHVITGSENSSIKKTVIMTKVVLKSQTGTNDRNG